MSMTLIEHIEVGSGGQAEIEFASIPDTFTDLYLTFSLRCQNAVVDLGVRYNGVSTGYSMKLLYGTGSATGTASNASSYLVWAGTSNSSAYTSNTFSNGSIYIPNYTSSEYKSSSHDSVTENNAAGSVQYSSAGLWSNTSVINSILLTLAPSAGGDFQQYSSASLYGVTAGSDGTTTVS